MDTRMPQPLAVAKDLGRAPGGRQRCWEREGNGEGVTGKCGHAHRSAQGQCRLRWGHWDLVFGETHSLV